MKLKVLPCSAWISEGTGQALQQRGLQVSIQSWHLCLTGRWRACQAPGKQQSDAGGRVEQRGLEQVRESHFTTALDFYLLIFFLSCVPNLIDLWLYRKGILLNFILKTIFFFFNLSTFVLYNSFQQYFLQPKNDRLCTHNDFFFLLFSTSLFQFFIF